MDNCLSAPCTYWDSIVLPALERRKFFISQAGDGVIGNQVMMSLQTVNDGIADTLDVALVLLDDSSHFIHPSEVAGPWRGTIVFSRDLRSTG